jgi:hypothetical protein
VEVYDGDSIIAGTWLDHAGPGLKIEGVELETGEHEITWNFIQIMGTHGDYAKIHVFFFSFLLSGQRADRPRTRRGVDDFRDGRTNPEITEIHELTLLQRIKFEGVEDGGAESCKSCSAGSVSQGGVSSCTICQPGQYSGEKASTCISCSRNTFAVRFFFFLDVGW